MTQTTLTDTVAFRLAQREREQLDELAAKDNNVVSRIVRQIVVDYLLKKASQ